MNEIPLVQSLSPADNDRIDRRTGLRRLPVAQIELPQIVREMPANRMLGIIAFGMPPCPAIYRLSPEMAQVLRHGITEKINAFLRPSDHLYSVSAWEWLCVLPALMASPALTLAMLRIRQTVNELCRLKGLEHLPEVSCGAAQWPTDGEDPAYLIQSARIAMLSAQLHGNNMENYSPTMESASDQEVSFQRELKEALINNQNIFLFLQPQIDLITGQCFGAEALLRMRAKNGEWISPPRIVEAIGQLGLRPSFNRWLFQQAAQTQQRLQEKGIEIVLSINLSASDLLDVELPDLIGQTLATWNISPEKILLEITETTMVEETLQVAEVMQRMQAQGLALSIDDFGTGYAGMGYLQRLPVQEVKIDQSFVRRALDSERTRAIITSITELANRLNMRVLAEGIETEEVRDAILALGCHHGQGYLFSKPLPLDVFFSWWNNR